MAKEKSIVCKVEKVDSTLNVVFGYACISTQNGIDYFDKQLDCIQVDDIAEAYIKANGQVETRDMHKQEDKGKVVFAMPVYASGGDLISKSGKTGFYVGAQFDDDIFNLYKTGERKAFSMGGKARRDTDAAA